MSETRIAARLIVLDADNRILLFRYIDADGRSFWATPGGGVEAGETTDQAARREACEELGSNQVKLRQLWTACVEIRIGHRDVKQTEVFLLLDCDQIPFGQNVIQYHELEGIRESRWWSSAEIEVADDPIFPTDLVRRLHEMTMSNGRQVNH